MGIEKKKIISLVGTRIFSIEEIKIKKRFSKKPIVLDLN